MNKTNKPKKTIIKNISIESWLVMANIVITVVMGIYLAIRNENLQRQLISLQSQTKLASIFIEQNQDVYRGQAFDVSNQGFAIAEDLKIVLCISDINLNLVDKVDISQIYVSTKNTAVDFAIEPSKRISGDKYGCETLTIKTIVPGEKIHFDVKANFTSQLSEGVELSREFFFAIPRNISDQSQSPENLVTFAEMFYRNLYDDYLLAYVSVDVSCSNCNVNDRIESLSISYPNMGGTTISKTDQSETENYIKIRETITYLYFPLNSRSFPDTPVYLKVISDDSHVERLSQLEYDALK